MQHASSVLSSLEFCSLALQLTYELHAVISLQNLNCCMKLLHCFLVLINNMLIFNNFVRQSGAEVPVGDAYATARACGGSHTLTFPHRRVTRLQQVRYDETRHAVSISMDETITLDSFSVEKFCWKNTALFFPLQGRQLSYALLVACWVFSIVWFSQLSHACSSFEYEPHLYNKRTSNKLRVVHASYQLT